MLGVLGMHAETRIRMPRTVKHKIMITRMKVGQARERNDVLGSYREGRERGR